MGYKMKGYNYPGNSPAKQKKKVDPDAPGKPGQPGHEPPVTMDPNTFEWKGIHPGEGQGYMRKGKYMRDMHGERDFSEHNIHARRTEGTIAQQKALRKKRK
tara:strand:+ start:457 stop:759 length:303 start_codon:yes stop_codon:yes gene_type:complete